MSKNIKRNSAMGEPLKKVDVALRRKQAEGLASVGMLLLAAGIMVPLFFMFNMQIISICKWVFAGGTLLFFAARCIPVSAETDSIRLKRLRRMEFWAGACFLVAAFFWFYNEQKYEDVLAMGMGAMSLLRDTIVFSMAGAALQIVGSWMIYYREKKERA